MEVVEVPAYRHAVVERLHVDLRVDPIEDVATTVPVELGDKLSKFTREGLIDVDRSVDRQADFALHGLVARVMTEPDEKPTAHAASYELCQSIQERVHRTVGPALPAPKERRGEVTDDETAIDGHVSVYHATRDVSTGLPHRPCESF
jgi:hypothetical protein